MAALTEVARVLNYFGGVTAALKQDVESQTWADNRSVEVMIDGYSTWHAT